MAFAVRSPARALAVGLPGQDHVYSTTEESFRFHNKNFDEMRCKLDSTENLRSFENYPTPVATTQPPWTPRQFGAKGYQGEQNRGEMWRLDDYKKEDDYLTNLW